MGSSSRSPFPPPPAPVLGAPAGLVQKFFICFQPQTQAPSPVQMRRAASGQDWPASRSRPPTPPGMAPDSWPCRACRPVLPTTNRLVLDLLCCFPSAGGSPQQQDRSWPASGPFSTGHIGASSAVKPPSPPKLEGRKSTGSDGRAEGRSDSNAVERTTSGSFTSFISKVRASGSEPGNR